MFEPLDASQMIATTPSWSGEIADWNVFCNASHSALEVLSIARVFVRLREREASLERNFTQIMRREAFMSDEEQAELSYLESTENLLRLPPAGICAHRGADL
jgi:hypothetical protein